MPMPEKPVVIDREEFPAFLKGCMTGRSIEQFAAHLGISDKYLYMLLTGQRKPSERIARKVGLRQAFIHESSLSPKSTAIANSSNVKKRRKAQP